MKKKEKEQTESGCQERKHEKNAEGIELVAELPSMPKISAPESSNAYYVLNEEGSEDTKEANPEEKAESLLQDADTSVGGDSEEKPEKEDNHPTETKPEKEKKPEEKHEENTGGAAPGKSGVDTKDSILKELHAMLRDELETLQAAWMETGTEMCKEICAEISAEISAEICAEIHREIAAARAEGELAGRNAQITERLEVPPVDVPDLHGAPLASGFRTRKSIFDIAADAR